MEIISWQFAVFTLVVLVLYYLLPRRAQNVWLLAASYGFYFSFGWPFLAVLVLTSAFNFLLAQRLLVEKRLNRPLLWFGICANILALLFFRLADSSYWVLVTRALSDLAHLPGALNVHILLPVGFSFYVLQAISYLVDVSQGKLPASTDPVDFALYMAYFPRLVSGPIERARTFLPQLAKPRQVDNQRLSRGFSLILSGLVRKLLVAEALSAALPEGLFAQPAQFARPDLAAGLLLFAFSLYNDFAGYTDLVRGVSHLFGIDLTQNFNAPYFSRSFTEFWNRWHISLSHWLRDYIFFPLTRALRRRYAERYMLLTVSMPLLLTMLASGLWHKLGIYMLFWGLLHGLYQVIERLVELRWPARGRIEQSPVWRQVLSGLLVFALVVLAWVPFASPGFQQALQFYAALLTSTATPLLTGSKLLWPAIYISVSLALDGLQVRFRDEAVFLRWPRLAQAALLAVVLLALLFTLLWRENVVTSFVYQGF